MNAFFRMLTSALVALMALAPLGAQAAPNDAAPKEAAPRQTSGAISDRGFVTLGGIPQWVTVQGRHRSNPILVVLHGGPGFTLSPISYRYMQGWDEYFTVVQWDQRGAGKTFLRNDPQAVKPTMSLDRMVGDAEELVAYLRKTYAVDRVVLMGHSFGTILGVELAQRRPEWLYAYVGMGQFVDFQRNEALGYQQTLAAARAAGDDRAIRELTAIAPFPDPRRPERNFQNLAVERRWLNAYGGYFRTGGVAQEAEVAAHSPDYTGEELKARDQGEAFSSAALWGELGHVDFTRRNRFAVPVVIMQGRGDRGTSATLLDGWFKTLQAPSKRLIWFEDSAHMVFEEEPGKTLTTLVATVRPLAVRGK